MRECSVSHTECLLVIFEIPVDFTSEGLWAFVFRASMRVHGYAGARVLEYFPTGKKI